MGNINWAQKLTSRKLWMAVAGLLTGVLLALKVDDNLVVQIGGAVMSFGSVIAYIVGEGLVDAARNGIVVVDVDGKPPGAEK